MDAQYCSSHSPPHFFVFDFQTLSARVHTHTSFVTTQSRMAETVSDLTWSAHVLGGAVTVLVMRLFSKRLFVMLLWLLVLQVVIVVKEFWWDIAYENNPPQTVNDGFLDWAQYDIGAAIGVVIVVIAWAVDQCYYRGDCIGCVRLPKLCPPDSRFEDNCNDPEHKGIGQRQLLQQQMQPLRRPPPAPPTAQQARMFGYSVV
jgi:hypothetical protein